MSSATSQPVLLGVQVALGSPQFPRQRSEAVHEMYFSADGTGVAAQATISIVQPACTLRVVDRFNIDMDNTITGQENHFDPRPALHDG